MRNVIMWKEGEQSWIRWIKKRIQSNLNFLAIFEGPVGIGKSWASLSVAYDIDPEFNPREQISFSFVEMMRIINNFNNKENPLSKKKYKVLMFDECQTNLSNREWQSRVNKLFNYLLSTFRHQNIIVLFTSPYSDFVDSASMKLIHCKFEVKGWNAKTKKTHIRPKLLQYNSRMKKFYEHSLMVIKDGKYNKLVNWLVKCPPKHLIEPYEQMKSEFTAKLNKEITEELENEGKEPAITLKPLTMIQQMAYDMANEGKTPLEIANELNISERMAYTHLKLIKNKGYALPDRRNKQI